MSQLDIAPPIETADHRAGAHHVTVNGTWREELCTWAYRRGTAYMYELDRLADCARDVAVEPLPAEFCFRKADLEEMAACARMAQAPVEEYRRRWKEGEECHAVFRDGRPVNVTWLHFGSCFVHGLGLCLEAPRTECYLYNVYTDPACRGAGLYDNTQRQLISSLAQRGIQRIRQAVMVDNLVPQKVLPRLGYALTHVVHHRCLLGLKRTTLTDLDGRAFQRRWFYRVPGDVFQI